MSARLLVNQVVVGCRQSGKSYIGILDDSQSTMSILDIPFTDIVNIVRSHKTHLVMRAFVKSLT